MSKQHEAEKRHAIQKLPMRGLALALVVVLAFGSCAVDDRSIELVGVTNLLPPSDSAVDAGSIPGAEPDSTRLNVTPTVEIGVPELAVNATALAWGPLPIGLAGVKSLQMTNVGNAVLSRPQLSLATNDAAFTIFLNRCETDLGPGESCEARLQFLPSAVIDSGATLQVDTGVGGSATLELTGAGLAPGVLLLNSAAESSAEFGSIAVDATVTQTFILHNPGETPSGAFDIFVNSPEFAQVTPGVGGCIPNQTNLSTGESCSIAIAFTPPARGRADASLVVHSVSVGASGINLSGEGLGVGELGASADAVDFQGVVQGVVATAELELINQGDLELPLGAAQISGINAEEFAIATSTCGESLEANARCAVQLQFSPGGLGPRSASLLVPAAGVEHAFALNGIGLQPGSLVLSAAPENAADFSDVLVNESRVQTFTLQNPGAQPSGALFAITAGNDFVPLQPTQPSDCQVGITSLVNGESCTISVSFRPTQRAARSASLTVESPFTGTTGLQLLGRGIVPPQVSTLAAVVDFSDVVQDQSASATVVVTNTGDLPLTPPALSVVGDGASAFTYASVCTAELEPGARCEVTVTFVPADAGRYSVTLQLDAGLGGTTGVALRGNGILPGALVVAPAANNSALFGDVGVAVERLQTFEVSNPGGVASGPLAISIRNTDNSVTFSRVLPTGTDCTDSSTLVNGESCTVRVRFLPPTNLSFSANLRVSSPAAGTQNLSLSGRGVRAAILSQSESRDFGSRAVSDLSAAPAFTRAWTVSNRGDVATSALTLTPTNPGEFVITVNGCSGSLAAAASCTLSVEFRPATVGRRTGQITLAAGATQVTLSMSGNGFQRSGPGGTCSTAADCQGGVNAVTCGNGANGARICCDSACQGTCEFCNAQGQCVARQGGEQCSANEPLRGCFGRNRCLLPNGQGCSGDNANCGSGNCEPAAGGGASVCCGANCALGQECSPTFQTCLASLGGRGDACGTASDCEGGLACGRSIDGAGGRCCASACAGNCQGCDATGACVARPQATLCGSVGQVCINATVCDFPRCLVGSIVGQCKL